MIKKITSIWTVLILITPINAVAENCGWWQSHLNYTNSKLRRGGNQSEMLQWEHEQDYYADGLEKCQKRDGSYNWVATANNPDTNQYRANVQFRQSNTNNPILRKAVNTCNYWINEYNKNATKEMEAMKNSACKSADSLARDLSNQAPSQNLEIKKSVKDCIKENNVIDAEVLKCMKGENGVNWDEVLKSYPYKSYNSMTLQQKADVADCEFNLMNAKKEKTHDYDADILKFCKRAGRLGY